MASLKDILEPGERVIARDPLRWPFWVATAFMLLPVIMLVGMSLQDGERSLAEWIDQYGIATGLQLAFACLPPILGRWRLLVTDRRAIARTSFLGNKLDWLPLEDIREIRPQASGILLRARDRELFTRRFPFGPVPAAVLQALDRAYRPSPATDDGKPDDGLLPGETVLKRSSKPWPMIWQFAVGIGGLTGIIAEASYEALLEEPSKIFPLAGILLFMLAFFGGMAWFAVVARGDRWLVTDRRIRVASGMFRSRKQEIMIDAIEVARFNHDHLHIRGGGQAMDIRGAHIPAALLNRILPRQFPDGGSSAAKLNKLLQPGETLLMRNPGRWADAMPWLATTFAVVCTAGILLLPVYFGIPQSASYLMTSVMAILLLLGSLFEVRRTRSWRIAVTDRRLLRIYDHDPQHYEGIETDKIKSIRYLPEKRGLSIRLDDREIDIACEPQIADRILTALGRLAELQS